MAGLVPVHRPLPLTTPVAAGRLAEAVFRTEEGGVASAVALVAAVEGLET